MTDAPFGFEALNLVVLVSAAGVEAAPSAEPAAVAERQIAGFTDLAASFIRRRHRALEDARRGHAIGFQRRIAGVVELPVSVELPLLAGHPGKDAGFDRR